MGRTRRDRIKNLITGTVSVRIRRGDSEALKLFGQRNSSWKHARKEKVVEEDKEGGVY